MEELQRAYQLLQESNEKLYNSMKAFQIAAEESGSLVFSYDTKEQKILVDEKTAKAFHVEPVQTGVPYEMVDRGIISKDTVEEYVRIHEAVIHGAKEAQGIVKLIEPGKKEAVYQLSFRAILNEKGKPTGTAIGIYRDITKRYVYDKEQERYREIVYSSDRYTFQYKMKEDIMSVYVPPAVTNSRKETEICYPNYLENFEKESQCTQEEVRAYIKFLYTGGTEPFHIRLYEKRIGAFRWYALTGTVKWEDERPVRILGTISDITDFKEKEKIHRKMERVFESIKEEYIGIYEIDMETDEYTVLSTNIEEPSIILKERGCYSAANEKVATELATPEYREILKEFGSLPHLKEALSSEKRIELEFMTRDKNHVWRRNIYQVVGYENEKPAKIILYQSDIDKIKAEKLMQQQAMRDAYKLAESANVAKTEFLSRMSHDIRTPLNAIIGMTAIAGMHLDNHEQVQDCLNKINMSSKHLLSLINEVLDMSKIESGKIELQEEEFNLADLVDSMITMMMPQINEHKHTIQVTGENFKNEWVMGDKLRIQQVFGNLITNAVKYTPDGGRIHVHIKERPANAKNYGEYEFVFEDNGIGMSEEFQKFLFEPFTRAEDSRVRKITGTGLGMAITRNIIRMMDGDIQVESRLNEGSRFTVIVHMKLLEKKEENPGELENLPVLVVDDDEAVCESACILLEDIGMQGEWCLSGKEAIKRIKSRHEKKEDYFAVMVDWKMPGLSGVDTVREIRRLVGKDITIIMISAYDWSEIENEARSAGVDKFIAKPLFKSRLVRGLQEFAQEEKKEIGEEIFSKNLHFTGKKVLLVEDNELNAEIAREILKITGISVEWAEDGFEAIQRMESSREGTYDMVFMDIQMPGMNGYEAAKAIRALNRQDTGRIPIVAMTANAFAEDVYRAKKAGMNEHIAKPINFEQLEEILIKYLN